MTAMTWEAYTDKEPRSIGAAVRHGRFGSACAAAMVALAIAVSICAIVLVLGTDAAFAAAPRLITTDEHGRDYGVLVPVLLIVIALSCFAADSRAPAYARRRRNRR
jgi:hypothetical protein